jgi:hypothetical protein
MKPRILTEHLFLLGTLTATGTAAGYSIEALRDWRTSQYWKSASDGTNYLTIDFSAATYDANAIGIMKHNLGTVAAAVSIEHWDSDISDWGTSLAAFTPTSDVAIFKFFTLQEDRTKYRIKIVTTGGKLPKIGELQIGTYYEFDQNANSPLTSYTEQVEQQSAESLQKNYLGTVITGFNYAADYQFANVSKTWFDATFRVIWESHLKLGYPFFWAVDGTALATELWYARLKPDYVLSPSRNNTSVCDFNLALILNK